jgi:hypothetical protein
MASSESRPEQERGGDLEYTKVDGTMMMSSVQTLRQVKDEKKSMQKTAGLLVVLLLLVSGVGWFLLTDVGAEHTQQLGAGRPAILADMQNHEQEAAGDTLDTLVSAPARRAANALPCRFLGPRYWKQDQFQDKWHLCAKAGPNSAGTRCKRQCNAIRKMYNNCENNLRSDVGMGSCLVPDDIGRQPLNVFTPGVTGLADQHLVYDFCWFREWICWRSHGAKTHEEDQYRAWSEYYSRRCECPSHMDSVKHLMCASQTQHWADRAKDRSGRYDDDDALTGGVWTMGDCETAYGNLGSHLNPNYRVENGARVYKPRTPYRPGKPGVRRKGPLPP